MLLHIQGVWHPGMLCDGFDQDAPVGKDGGKDALVGIVSDAVLAHVVMVCLVQGLRVTRDHTYVRCTVSQSRTGNCLDAVVFVQAGVMAQKGAELPADAIDTVFLGVRRSICRCAEPLLLAAGDCVAPVPSAMADLMFVGALKWRAAPPVLRPPACTSVVWVSDAMTRMGMAPRRAVARP
jgi:hypothetical protein